MGNNARYGRFDAPRSDYMSHGLRKPPGTSLRSRLEIEEQLHDLARLRTCGGREKTHTLWARYPANSLMYSATNLSETEDPNIRGPWKRVKNYDSERAAQQGLDHHRNTDNVLRKFGAEFCICLYGENPNNEVAE